MGSGHSGPSSSAGRTNRILLRGRAYHDGGPPLKVDSAAAGRAGVRAPSNACRAEALPAPPCERPWLLSCSPSAPLSARRWRACEGADGQGRGDLCTFYVPSTSRYEARCLVSAGQSLTARRLLPPFPMTRSPAGSILAAALLSSTILCASVQGGTASEASPKAPTALPCGDPYGFEVLLDQQSFSPGEIDGKLGTNVSHALAAAQAARGLQVTGEPDCDTWRALGGRNVRRHDRHVRDRGCRREGPIHEGDPEGPREAGLAAEARLP